MRAFAGDNVKVTKAVIPAAGLGTRFLPITKAMPKEMLPIIDKPIIHYVIEEAVAAGLDDIILITGQGKRTVEDYFDTNMHLYSHLSNKGHNKELSQLKELDEMADIHFIRQKEQKGLGHAVLCAEKHVGDEPCVVLLGDTIVKADNCTTPLINLYKKYKATILGVEEVPHEMVSKYGIVAGDEVEPGVLKLTNMVEKPAVEEATSNLAIFGRYLLTPEIFECLRNTKPGYGNEIQLTDGIELLRQKQDIYSYTITEQRYDIGKKILYFKAFVDFALQRKDIGEDAKEYLQQLVSK